MRATSSESGLVCSRLPPYCDLLVRGPVLLPGGAGIARPFDARANLVARLKVTGRETTSPLMVRVLSVRVGEAIADAELHGGEVTRPIVGPIVVGGEHRWPSQGRAAGGRSVVAGACPSRPHPQRSGRRPTFDVSVKGPTRAGLTLSTPRSPRRRSIPGCRWASPRGTGTPHAVRWRGVRGRCSR